MFDILPNLPQSFCAVNFSFFSDKTKISALPTLGVCDTSNSKTGEMVELQEKASSRWFWEVDDLSGHFESYLFKPLSPICLTLQQK
jgi:hypothetical protein